MWILGLKGLRNINSDVNKNGKKAIGLVWQNNNSACATDLLYTPLLSLHDYNVTIPNFMFCGGREHKTTTFFFFP